MIEKGKCLSSSVVFANRDLNLGSTKMFEIFWSQKNQMTKTPGTRSSML